MSKWQQKLNYHATPRGGRISSLLGLGDVNTSSSMEEFMVRRLLVATAITAVAIGGTTMGVAPQAMARAEPKGW
jgi:hypothetical protein